MFIPEYRHPAQVSKPMKTQATKNPSEQFDKCQFSYSLGHQLGKHTSRSTIHLPPAGDSGHFLCRNGKWNSCPIHTGGEHTPSCHLGTTAEWDSLEPGFLSRAHSAACSRPVNKEHSTQLKGIIRQFILSKNKQTKHKMF